MSTSDTNEPPIPRLIEDLGRLYPAETSKHKARFGVYECPLCGVHFKANTNDIKSRHTKSCGCIKLKNIKVIYTKHNDSTSRIYSIWRGIIGRVTNPKNPRFNSYGGRGIDIYPDWLNYLKFKEWVLGSGYSPDLSIDRIDNDGNYEPSNCRWTTSIMQSRNQRIRSNNTSGYRGVWFSKQANKWIVEIKVDKVKIHIGTFESALAGAIAYNNYIIENALENFVLNKIEGV